jgi:hypothetical protein
VGSISNVERGCRAIVPASITPGHQNK